MPRIGKVEVGTEATGLGDVVGNKGILISSAEWGGRASILSSRTPTN
jgi:hypothetical protein